ncbi:MAG: hypothetical protein ACXVIY_10050 [Mucilaginibacter sp.]
MKVVRIIFLIIVFALMLTITLAYFSPANKFVFGRNSADYMLKLAAVSVVWPIALLVLYLLFAWFYHRKPNRTRLALVTTVVLLWFLCGRMVGTLLWPEGKVITGWYYIPTYDFKLCGGDTDCETVVYYQTHIEKLAFWRLRIKNRNVDQTVFAGPFIWNQIPEVFSEIGTGKYTK